MSDLILNMHVNCNNRKPFADEYVLSSGHDSSGKPTVVMIQNRMSKSCKLDTKATQPGCVGCHWRDNEDPRDAK